MKEKIFKATVDRLERANDQKGRPLTIHSLLVKEKGKTYLHYFEKENQMSDIRSISKSVLTLVLGRVMTLADEGEYPELSEETFVFPTIRQQVHLKNKENLKQLEKIKIKHLLTHTIGYDKVLLMREDIIGKDPFSYLDYLVNEPIVYEPGEYYLYSNAGFYLLSVFLEEFLQEDLGIFLKREFFEPLGIETFTWEKYGYYLAGATRLWLTPDDLLKIGEIFINQGQIDSQAFISKDWLAKMLLPRIETPSLDASNRIFQRAAYGYGIWLSKNSFYFGHGTDGQRLIVLPQEETLIIILAEQLDTQPIDQEIDHLLEHHFNKGAKE